MVKMRICFKELLFYFLYRRAQRTKYDLFSSDAWFDAVMVLLLMVLMSVVGIIGIANAFMDGSFIRAIRVENNGLWYRINLAIVVVMSCITFAVLAPMKKEAYERFKTFQAETPAQRRSNTKWIWMAYGVVGLLLAGATGASLLAYYAAH